MHFNEMFQQIEEYHKKLGHNDKSMQSMRNNALALMMELAELVDSTPWKPWKSIKDQTFDKDNAVREVVDIIFFLVGICENLEITPFEIEDKFKHILQHNYERLESGYSLKRDMLEHSYVQKR